MCPRPGMMLRITATASLALPSAVSVVAARVQSHRSQRCASLGRRCPQCGHGILSDVLGWDRAAGASVYSTLIEIASFENPKPCGIRQAKSVENKGDHGLREGNLQAFRRIPFVIGSRVPRIFQLCRATSWGLRPYKLSRARRHSYLRLLSRRHPRYR